MEEPFWERGEGKQYAGSGISLFAQFGKVVWISCHVVVVGGMHGAMCIVLRMGFLIRVPGSR